MMNFTTTTEILKEDYFKELYSDTILKQVALAVFFVGCIFGLIAEFGVIWYERNGKHPYRTVINQLVSTIAGLIVSHILLVYIPYGVRYLTGPLNATFCDVHNFLQNFIWICIVMTMDCNIVLRYMYIFKWTGFSVINDDRIARFLQLTIAFVGLWMCTVKRMSVGRMPLNYYMCAGINPQGENIPEFNVTKFDAPRYLVLGSYVLHIFVFAKIFLYQRKMERKMKRVQLGIIHSSGNNDQPQILAKTTVNLQRFSNLSKGMVDLVTQSMTFAYFFTNAILLSIMNRMKPNELNEYQNRWIVYWNQLIGIGVALIVLRTIYYIRKFSPCQRA